MLECFRDHNGQFQFVNGQFRLGYGRFRYDNGKLFLVVSKSSSCQAFRPHIDDRTATGRAWFGPEKGKGGETPKLPWITEKFPLSQEEGVAALATSSVSRTPSILLTAQPDRIVRTRRPTRIWVLPRHKIAQQRFQ
jgi:hypothetical protein